MGKTRTEYIDLILASSLARGKFGELFVYKFQHEGYYRLKGIYTSTDRTNAFLGNNAMKERHNRTKYTKNHEAILDLLLGLDEENDTHKPLKPYQTKPQRDILKKIADNKADEIDAATYVTEILSQIGRLVCKKTTWDFVEIFVWDFCKEYLEKATDKTICVEQHPVLKEYVYNPNMVELYSVETLDRYIELISIISRTVGAYNKNKPDMEQYKLYYRGHKDSNYTLIPSIYRKRVWSNHEREMCEELERLCPQRFAGLNGQLDRLVEMQHYELPTRLLDISANAMAALLFACDTEDKKDEKLDGEVLLMACKGNPRYGRSDTASMLSMLAQLTGEEKEELREAAQRHRADKALFNNEDIVDILVRKINYEKPSFTSRINPEDLLGVFFVLPALMNQRIIKQSGAFLLAGLLPDDMGGKLKATNRFRLGLEDRKMLGGRISEKEIPADKRVRKAPVILIPGAKKARMAEELQLCDLHSAAIYPEIDKVAKYIQDKKYV